MKLLVLRGAGLTRNSKEFTYHTRRDPMTCLVTQFLVLCIHNGALRESARLTISAVLSLVIPPDRHKVVLAWHPEWLLKPVFTAPKADGTACELSRDQASRWLRGLGEGMGLKENLTWRCWRRLVSNAVDGEMKSSCARCNIANKNRKWLRRTAKSDYWTP